MTKLTGRVLDAHSPGWQDARRNFRSCVDYDALVPRAVVFCQNTGDVQNAVRWAREQQVAIRVRSGRHSYEAYSVAADALVVDVSEMDEISIDGESQTAHVGAGVFCLDLHQQLYDVGFTVPAASGASVGIAGLALGGGFGVTSRKYGLTCDNVIGVTLVDANGDFVYADREHNPDLYWACRGGGGGNFGIVTSFDFKLQPVSFVAICNVTWQWQDFDAIVGAWQQWAPQAPNEISTFLRLAANGVITLFGQITPDDPSGLAGFATALQPLLSCAPPTGINIQAMPYGAAAAVFAGADPANTKWMIHPHNDRQPFKSTSAVAQDIFPAEALSLLRSHMEAVQQADWETNEPSMVQLLAGGGAPGDVPIDATAVPHRRAKFIVQYDAYWTDPADQQRSTEWIEGVRTAMLPYAKGAYVNYVDSLIEDYLDQYYGPNLERLIDIKASVDPDNFFAFPQSVPVVSEPQPVGAR
jgi:FAD/FMN-containing dehydrogenase